MGRSGQTSSGKKSAGSGKKKEGGVRPGASGHRFGPDLACSECGILWDEHQQDPKPCQTKAAADAFARRPSGNFEAPAPPVENADESKKS